MPVRNQISLIPNNGDGDPTPLNCQFPGQSSDWVLHKAKEIQQLVGLNCDGFEEQFLPLLTAIEVAQAQGKKSVSKKQELKRSSWSLNYASSAS